jgi:hypothetical protein
VTGTFLNSIIFLVLGSTQFLFAQTNSQVVGNPGIFIPGTQSKVKVIVPDQLKDKVYTRPAGELPIKRAYVMGGGGEPLDEPNQFADDFKVAGGALLASGYQTKVLFDGGHASAKEVAKHFGIESVPPITKKNMQNEWASLVNDMNTGKLRSGDQVLMVLNSHGTPSSGLTHEISTSDTNVSLDTLKFIREKAEAAGIKLAIVDLSCYSGSTLSLSTHKTCVISSSTSKNLGYSDPPPPRLRSFLFRVLKSGYHS